MIGLGNSLTSTVSVVGSGPKTYTYTFSDDFDQATTSATLLGTTGNVTLTTQENAPGFSTNDWAKVVFTDTQDGNSGNPSISFANAFDAALENHTNVTSLSWDGSATFYFDGTFESGPGGTNTSANQGVALTVVNQGFGSFVNLNQNVPRSFSRSGLNYGIVNRNFVIVLNNSPLREPEAGDIAYVRAASATITIVAD